MIGRISMTNHHIIYSLCVTFRLEEGDKSYPHMDLNSKQTIIGYVYPFYLDR